MKNKDYSVTAHDGDKGNFKPKSISKLGRESEVGDAVLAYHGWQIRYAFKGVHEKTNGSNIYVKYDDGDKAWEEVSKVHKLVAIDVNDIKPKARYGKQYFVQWDNPFSIEWYQNRWFESDVTKQSTDKVLGDLYTVTAHDGEKKYSMPCRGQESQNLV